MQLSVTWGGPIPQETGQFWGRHLLAHCGVHGIFCVSRSYSLGGSDDAAFRCQYCSNSFPLILLVAVRTLDCVACFVGIT